MTLSKLEHLAIERRLMSNPVKAIDLLLQSAMADINTIEPDMGWREHSELIDAWRNGLQWFVNMEGGYALYNTWQRYLSALKRAEYSGESFDEAYDEEGLGD